MSHIGEAMAQKRSVTVGYPGVVWELTIGFLVSHIGHTFYGRDKTICLDGKGLSRISYI